MQIVKPTSERYPRSRLLTASSMIGTVMLVVFIFEKIFLPQNENGWSIPPWVDGVIFFGIGLPLSVAMAQYAYQAWSLDSRSFIEWHSCQQIISTNWLDWYDFPGWNLRSLYRLIGPIGFLAGVAMAGLGLVMTAASLFSA